MQPFRVAHLTDVHLQPGDGSAEALGSAIEHAQESGAQMLVFGGDCVMDSLAESRERVEALWELFTSTVERHARVPVEYVLGNHDVWGWDARSGAVESDPRFGKGWAMELWGRDKPYRAFEAGGWQFVLLDSVMRGGNLYQGGLDDAQFDWFADVTRVDRPTIVLSHIPILSTCAMLFSDFERSGRAWEVPDWLLHMDARRIKNLFAERPNVRLCVSGHIHLRDRVDYNGVTYLCCGALSGAWWKGPFQETPPGYTLIDLLADGTWGAEYVVRPH
jgi:3',5'-cyclic-AMP phosphodiesterase